MNFGEALQALKEGRKIKRETWGGYWYLATNVYGEHNALNSARIPFGMSVFIIAVLEYSGIKVPASPYQTDLLAEDWEILES
jgi:hypothetical protein